MSLAKASDYIRANNIIKNHNISKRYYSIDDLLQVISCININPFTYTTNDILRKHIGDLDPLSKYFLISEGFDIESTNSWKKLGDFLGNLAENKYKMDATTDIFVIHAAPDPILCLLDISYSKDTPPTESQISILKDKLADDNFKKKIMSACKLKEELQLKINMTEDSNLKTLYEANFKLVQSAENMLFTRINTR